ncbi:MAG: hypothetical protein LLG42_14025 [Chloroflexi bacterium]|nr:hypothetical protein [Chloroflexota bacterium]
MKITLKLFITYKSLLPANSNCGECEIEVAAGSQPREILLQYGVPVDENTVILVNGRSPLNLDAALCEGDILCAFPVAAGGCS